MLGWVLLNEDGFNGHDLGGFPSSLDVDLEFDMTVNPGPGSSSSRVMIGSIRFPIQRRIAINSSCRPITIRLGAAKVMSSLVEMPATPGAGGYDGFYVLDFLMSPPGTPIA